MREISGDIWDFHKQGHWIVITTNGTVRKDGACVMGRGVAKQAAEKFPGLPYILGEYISSMGNHVNYLTEFKIISFPVKHNWWEAADTSLIDTSCQEIRTLVDNLEITYPFGGPYHVYMVRPGCGNGGLDWKDVKPILEKYLDDRFVVVEYGAKPTRT